MKSMRVFVMMLLVMSLFSGASGASAAVTQTPILLFAERQPDTTTYKLFMKTGDGQAELLTTFVSAHTPAYRLSYSQKTLAINLTDSILFVDLRTKVSKVILTAPEGASYFPGTAPTTGVAISPDDTRALAIEQSLVTIPDATTGFSRTAYHYVIKIVTVATGNVQELKSGFTQQIFLPRFWRTDGKVVLTNYSGKFLLLNPMTGALQAPKLQPSGLFSGDGTMITQQTALGSTCSPVNDAKKSRFSIFNYETGKSLGVVPTTGWAIRPIAVSPSKQKMLFSAYEVCDDSTSLKYFIGNMVTKTVVETKDYLSVMKDYGAWYIGARDGYDHKSGKYVITVNGTPTVISANPLTIAAQFWKVTTTAPKPVQNNEPG